MTFKQAIENLRNAGLQAEADFFIAYRNRAQTTSAHLGRQLAEVEAMANDLSAGLERLARGLRGKV